MDAISDATTFVAKSIFSVVNQDDREGAETRVPRKDSGDAQVAAIRRNSADIIAFTERSQQLGQVTRRLSSGGLVAEKVLATFSQELANYHVVSSDMVLQFLHSDGTRGLTGVKASKTLQDNGPNVMPKPKETPMLIKFILSFFNGFGPLLWIACFFVFLSWEPFGTPPSNIYNLALAIVLLVVIVISGMFNFYQEIVTSQVMSNFQSMLPPMCVVTRDGKAISISPEQLVIGDIVTLQNGARIPSDVRILKSSNMKIDKSILTGENEPVRLVSDPVAPTVPMLESCNMAFMGCNVVEGEGVGIVIATGANNQLAKIASQVNNVGAKQSTLQKDINKFVKIIGSLAFTTACVVILEWAFYLRVQHSSFMTFSSMIANAISVLVAFVPEGLPLALSMGLTIIARRLCVKHSVLSKQLSSIETLGSMSLLASDKTGTLTQNCMTVTSMITSAVAICTSEMANDLRASLVLGEAIRVAVMCNQASISKNETDQTGRPVAVGGNGIDKALLEWAHLHSAAEVHAADNKMLLMIPFSSVLKLSACVVSHAIPASDKSTPALRASTRRCSVLIKGAPEYILGRCTAYLDERGKEVVTDAAFLKKIQALVDEVSAKGQRVIALASLALPAGGQYTEAYPYRAEPTPNFPLTGLTFVACMAVSDPPREGVREAVEALRQAGVKVAMVTGDAPTTAIAIAKQVGIVSSDCDHFSDWIVESPSRRGSGDIEMGSIPSQTTAVVPTQTRYSDPRNSAVVILGKDLDVIDPAGWDFIFEHSEMVFARTTPEHKLEIVKECQRRKHIVGVTGDGVNDSPALKRADIGIAMNAGSDVAKDAAGMILLQDDFTAIPKGVEEGRLIFQNLRKVIGYQIAAGCWSELLPVLATFFFGMAQPLSSFLMIIISCVTDVFAGIALTCEPPESAIMKQKPRDPVETPLVQLRLVGYSYMFYGNISSIGAFIMYFLYMYHRGPRSQSLPNELPADDDGSLSFPIGYKPAQLISAWNWGVNKGGLGQDEIAAAAVGSSVFFVALTVAQWGHLCSIRRKTPYFSDAILDTKAKGGSVFSRMWSELLESPPRKEIILAIALSACTVNLFNETPMVQMTCGTGHVPAVYWGMAIGFSMLWFCIAEVRKWVVFLYPDSLAAKMLFAW